MRKAVSRAADWISNGDLLGKTIYAEQNFDLMKEHAVVSTVAPSQQLKGFIEGAPKWPGFVLFDFLSDTDRWFGKTSHIKANNKQLHYLHTHIRSFVSADATALRLDYLPTVVNKVVTPLEDPGGKVQSLKIELSSVRKEYKK